MKNIEILASQTPHSNGMVVCLKPHKPFALTPSLAHKIRNLQESIANNYCQHFLNEPFYVIWHLHTGKIPWRGIDFSFIHNALVEHKHKQLESYLDDLFELLFINYIGHGFPITNCSIITRPLNGLSQDFFYLNQVNFIKETNLPMEKNCHPLNITELNKKLYFPEELYFKNSFFRYKAFNFSEKQKILETVQHTPIPLPHQLKIKEQFKEIKHNTLQEIYAVASKNIKILERLAKRQASRG